MKKSQNGSITLFVIVGVILMALVVVGYYIYKTKQSSPEKQLAIEQQNQQELNKEVSQQEEITQPCAIDTKDFFDAGNYKYSNIATDTSYSSDYQQSTNQCFIDLEFSGMSNGKKVLSIEELYEVTTNTLYGLIILPEHYNFSTAASTCFVYLNSSVKYCSSLNEFLQLRGQLFKNGINF